MTVRGGMWEPCGDGSAFILTVGMGTQSHACDTAVSDSIHTYSTVVPRSLQDPRRYHNAQLLRALLQNGVVFARDPRASSGLRQIPSRLLLRPATTYVL